LPPTFYLDLNFDLNLSNYPSLLGALFERSFETLLQKNLASLFGSMFEPMLA